ncbi:MAG: ParA family protein [Candidatus Aminicenantales bacterium]
MENSAGRRIALANHKGGVGKTTTAINLSTALAKLKKKVLLIDIDPGAHATYGLGVLAHRRKRTVYDLLKGRAPLEEIRVEIAIEKESLDLIPASLELSEAEVELSGFPGREFLLKEALAHVRGYDYIFVDCPPSLGVLTLNALVAVREVFIPLQTEYLAMQGLGKLLETIRIVKSRLNPALEITGVLATRFDRRKILNREVVSRIRDYFGSKVFDVRIRENISLAESPSHGLTIFEYYPGSYGAEDYMALANEVLKRGKHGTKEKVGPTGSTGVD